MQNNLKRKSAVVEIRRPSVCAAFCPAGIKSSHSRRPAQRSQTQATTQVSWMLSGGVTFVLSLITYLFAAMLLSLCATVLLHQIWGIASL